MGKTKKSDKVFKGLVNMLKILVVVLATLFALIIYLDKQDEKKAKQQAMAKMPVIVKKVSELVEDNGDILDIKHNFEYGGINFIEAYVADTWFNSTNIEKKRYAMGIRDNVKLILFEEGFLELDDRVGIYVYSGDGIELATSDMYGEIKLKD